LKIITLLKEQSVIVQAKKAIRAWLNVDHKYNTLQIIHDAQQIAEIDR
jgi:hypothetical protein